MFSGCWALATIPLLHLPPLQVEGVSAFGGCLSSCVSLAAAPLAGIHQPVSFWGCALSRRAIVAIFQRLAVVCSNPSLEISENWGTRDLSAGDLAIATAKGWTVPSLVQTGTDVMALAIDLSDHQAQALAEAAARLQVSEADLAAAAVRDLIAQPADDFDAAAQRVLSKNAELVRRLA